MIFFRICVFFEKKKSKFCEMLQLLKASLAGSNENVFGFERIYFCGPHPYWGNLQVEENLFVKEVTYFLLRLTHSNGAFAGEIAGEPL